MVLELIVFRNCHLYLAQDVQEGLLAVRAELPENKGAVLKNKKRALQTGESVITVIFLIVLLKHDVMTSIAQCGVYCAYYLCF